MKIEVLPILDSKSIVSWLRIRLVGVNCIITTDAVTDTSSNNSIDFLFP
jgi:hypothetical protein